MIGSPVRHSLSPVIHNAGFAARRLDWVYLAFEVEPGAVPDALAGMRALGLGGLNVTMPHKEAVAAAVDRLTPEAEALGAVNTVVVEGDELVGHNTDGGGFVDALAADLGFDPAGRSCGVLGAGGAARAVVRALGQAGASRVVVVGRTPARVEAAAAHAGSAGAVGAVEDLAEVDLVVQATPVGMAGEPEPPVPASVIGPGQVVCDLIYAPLETPLLRMAADRGATTANGVGMLVHQAARSFELWTGEPAPIEAMRAAVAEHLSQP